MLGNGLQARIRGNNSDVNMRGAEMGYYILEFVVVCVAAFLGAYLREKGKNQATKEDMEVLTRKVEDIKTENAIKLEGIVQQNREILAQGEWKNRLRLAAIDKRLEAHQQAFSLWFKLLHSVYDTTTVGGVIAECQNWWIDNCLYLTPEVEGAFKAAYLTASIYSSLLRSEKDPKRLTESYERIRIVGEVIRKAVELPPLGEKDYDLIQAEQKEQEK